MSYRIETEGPLKVTGSHVHHKSSNSSQIVQRSFVYRKPFKCYFYIVVQQFTRF